MTARAPVPGGPLLRLSVPRPGPGDEGEVSQPSAGAGPGLCSHGQLRPGEWAHMGPRGVHGSGCGLRHILIAGKCRIPRPHHLSRPWPRQWEVLPPQGLCPQEVPPQCWALGYTHASISFKVLLSWAPGQPGTALPGDKMLADLPRTEGRVPEHIPARRGNSGGPHPHQGVTS